MTQNDLLVELKKTGFPTAYNAFKSQVKPPFVVFIRPSFENVSSDNNVHGRFQNYNVELYTTEKDLIAEKKLEDILGMIDPDFEVIEDYIESEGLLQNTYSITIFEKVGS